METGRGIAVSCGRLMGLTAWHGGKLVMTTILTGPRSVLVPKAGRAIAVALLVVMAPTMGHARTHAMRLA